MEERKGGNKAEQAAEALVAWIVAERLAPGDRIPREEELEEQLGVGRSTVREAVKLLASRNILEVRQGAGTFLSPKQGVTEDPLGFVLVQDKRKLAEDLLELRLILEPPIAALAAEPLAAGGGGADWPGGKPSAGGRGLPRRDCPAQRQRSSEPSAAGDYPVGGAGRGGDGDAPGPGDSGNPPGNLPGHRRKKSP